MKVIILNAGIGKRLQPITNKMPKCLIEISKNLTILDYQLKNVIECKLNDLIILTGAFEDKIKAYIRKNYSSLNVQYIYNPKYEKTNYIYSMYLTKDVIDDDIILFHGDLMFSNLLLKKIIKSKLSNCVLINKKLRPKKDFKAYIASDRVLKIGVNIFGPNSAFLAPLYKLTITFFKKWLNQIEKFVLANRLNVYAEDALNEILKQVILKPLYFNEKNCMEIDDFEDLNLIRNLMKNGRFP